MKLQDIVYIAVLFVLIVLRRPQLFLWAGLGSLVLAMPLFGMWVFFTAQRLTMYAAGFLFLYCIMMYRSAIGNSSREVHP